MAVTLWAGHEPEQYLQKIVSALKKILLVKVLPAWSKRDRVQSEEESASGPPN